MLHYYFFLPSLLLLLLMPFNYYFTSRGVHQRSGISVSSSSNKNAPSSPLFFLHLRPWSTSEREREAMFLTILSRPLHFARHRSAAAAAAAIFTYIKRRQRLFECTQRQVKLSTIYTENISLSLLCSALIFNNTSATTMRCDATTPWIEREEREAPPLLSLLVAVLSPLLLSLFFFFFFFFWRVGAMDKNASWLWLCTYKMKTSKKQLPERLAVAADCSFDVLLAQCAKAQKSWQSSDRNFSSLPTRLRCSSLVSHCTVLYCASHWIIMIMRNAPGCWIEKKKKKKKI